MVQRATPALSYRENFLKIENDKKNHNTDLEEVVARKTIYTSKRQGEGRNGRMNNEAGKGQRKNRKGCGISQWSGSGLYTQRRMTIVEWECLLKGVVAAQALPRSTQLQE